MHCSGDGQHERGNALVSVGAAQASCTTCHLRAYTRTADLVKLLNLHPTLESWQVLLIHSGLLFVQNKGRCWTIWVIPSERIAQLLESLGSIQSVLAKCPKWKEIAGVRFEVFVLSSVNFFQGLQHKSLVASPRCDMCQPMTSGRSYGRDWFVTQLVPPIFHQLYKASSHCSYY